MRILIKDVRLSFPALWTPEKFKESEEKKRYRASFIVTPDSETDKLIRATIWQIAQETFGGRAATLLDAWKNDNKTFCYTPGALKEYDGYAGNMILTANRKEEDGPPTVVDTDRAPLGQGSGRPYAGCYVDAIVDIYGQQGQNPGLRAGLAGVQFRRDGDAFSGARAAKTDEFENLAAGAGAAPAWGAPAGGGGAGGFAPAAAPSGPDWNAPSSHGMI